MHIESEVAPAEPHFGWWQKQGRLMVGVAEPHNGGAEDGGFPHHLK
jgi:hypothetical protein